MKEIFQCYWKHWKTMMKLSSIFLSSYVLSVMLSLNCSLISITLSNTRPFFSISSKSVFCFVAWQHAANRQLAGILYYVSICTVGAKCKHAGCHCHYLWHPRAGSLQRVSQLCHVEKDTCSLGHQLPISSIHHSEKVYWLERISVKPTQ